MIRIPRIIHQTWKDNSIPSYYTLWIKSWKEHHPEWEYLLWTDEMNRAFIEKYVPDFLKIYDGYPHNIQRVDAVRYFILYHIGGVFVDLDFECLENIEPLLDDAECVFGLEPPGHCAYHKKEMIVCNAFMACKRENDFFKTICEQLQEGSRKLKGVPQWLEILESAGPFKLTDLYNKYPGKDNITLIPASLLYPFTLHEVRGLIKNKHTELDDIAQKKIDDAYAVHYFLGSWW